MLLLGIDPGVSGALASLDSETNEIRFVDAPVMEVKVGKKFRHVPDAYEMARVLKDFTAGRECLVTIEKVNAMPDVGTGARMGATSAFSFGFGFGMWLGILAALEIPHQQVHPATWKSVTMAGMSKEKDASRQRAMQLYPKAASQLARKKDHARGDALLIARWSYLTYGGRSASKQEEPATNLLFQ
jgi:crossover junction endodeoxyribonuclease RuvC